MDDRQFDALSRRVGVSPLARLPRRGLIAVLGGATLASALHLEDEAEAKKKKNKNKKKNKKCQKEDKACDKKKCKKKNKKCCCKNLNCKNSVCVGKGGSCPTEVDFENTFANSGAGATNSPWGITYDSSGFVYIADKSNSRITVYSADGSNSTQFGSFGTGDKQFKTPFGIAYQSGKNRLVISDKGQTDSEKKLRRFQTNGENPDPIGVTNLDQPFGVAVDSNDRIWAVDSTGTGEIYLFDSSGNLLTNWSPSGSGQLNVPQGIAVYKDSQDGATYVYVTDTGNNRIVKFEYTGNSSSGLSYVTAAGSGGSGSSSFNTPAGVAVDTCGNLWVADQLNNRIQILDKNLNFKSRVSTDPVMKGPAGIAVNGSTLYVVNSDGNSAFRFSLS